MTESEHYSRVKRFMYLAKQEVPEEVTLPSAEVRELRANLILEEALETVAALGFHAEVLTPSNPGEKHQVILSEEETPDLVEIADGCADISVVNVGTLIACGIKDKALIRLVDENNLAKFGPGSSIREDGKLIKPPGHTPPNIKELLAAQ